jgi:hypothetical protein
MVDGAIEDLRKGGLDMKEIFNIIKDQLGRRYADKFCNWLYDKKTRISLRETFWLRLSRIRYKILPGATNR